MCRVSVRLLQVDDDITCIEFTRAGGDSLFFQEQYDELLMPTFDSLDDA